LYLTNRYSLNDLAHEVFKLGLTKRSGKILSRSQMANMLVDPFYYGAFKWGGEFYQGTHKPAISKKLYDNVQRLYSSRSRMVSRWGKDKIFCGLLRCNECGCSITAERHTRQMKNGNVHTWVYYRCTKKKGVPCSQGYVREENLAEQLKQGALSIALPDEMVVKMLGQIEHWEMEEESRVSEHSLDLRKESKEIEVKLSRLNDLLVDGEIDREEYSSRKKNLVHEKISVESQMKAIASEGVMYWLEPLKEFINAVWERNLKTAGDDFKKLRDFFAEGGSNLRIESRKVLLDWNLPHSLLAERVICTEWWRRRDSNPRPVRHPNKPLLQGYSRL